MNGAPGAEEKPSGQASFKTQPIPAAAKDATFEERLPALDHRQQSEQPFARETPPQPPLNSGPFASTPGTPATFGGSADFWTTEAPPAEPNLSSAEAQPTLTQDPFATVEPATAADARFQPQRPPEADGLILSARDTWQSHRRWLAFAIAASIVVLTSLIVFVLLLNGGGDTNNTDDSNLPPLTTEPAGASTPEFIPPVAGLEDTTVEEAAPETSDATTTTAQSTTASSSSPTTTVPPTTLAPTTTPPTTLAPTTVAPTTTAAPQAAPPAE